MKISANDLAAHLQESVILIGQLRTLLSLCLPPGARGETLEDLDNNVMIFTAALSQHYGTLTPCEVANAESKRLAVPGR